jgi:hypothetical protein
MALSVVRQIRRTSCVISASPPSSERKRPAILARIRMFSGEASAKTTEEIPGEILGETTELISILVPIKVQVSEESNTTVLYSPLTPTKKTCPNCSFQQDISCQACAMQHVCGRTGKRVFRWSGGRLKVSELRGLVHHASCQFAFVEYDDEPIKCSNPQCDFHQKTECFKYFTQHLEHCPLERNIGEICEHVCKNPEHSKFCDVNHQ